MHKNTNSTILRDCLQSLPPSLYWSVYIKSISVGFRRCSDKQSTWGMSGDKKLINSSDLFNRLLTFCWYTIKLFDLFEFHWGSLCSWGCHLKHLRPCFLHFRLSFCIRRYFITLTEPFIRQFSPTLRSMFTITKSSISLMESSIFTGYYYECNSVHNQTTKINCYLLGSAMLIRDNLRYTTIFLYKSLINETK